MNYVISIRRLGLCKEVMSYLFYSLLFFYYIDKYLDRFLLRGRGEGRFWRGLDSYVELLIKIFCKEGENVIEVYL